MSRFITRVTRLCVLAAAAFTSSFGSAQEYPSKPVTLVVPFAAGSFNDVSARVFAKELGKTFGQPFVVENRPGVAAIRQVKAATPNGLTLLWHSSSSTSGQALLAKPDYDFRKDFIPVAKAVQTPLAIFASTTSGLTSVKSIIDYAKKHPGKLNYGSAGIGTTTHLNAEIFMKRAGIDMVHIPYKGGSAVYTALMADEIDVLMYDPAFAAMIKEKGRLLAMLSKNRWSTYKEVPTIEESGGPLVDAVVWTGMFAPAGTPMAIVAQLNAAIKLAAEAPDVIRYMKTNGYESGWSPQESFQKDIEVELALWTEVVRFANLPLQ